MKKLALVVLLSVFGSSVSANDLTGVWALESGEYVNNEGETVDYKSIGLQSTKIISQSYFSFTSMRGGDFWASGSGRYELDDGKYIEKLEHNSFSEKPGATFTFKTKIDDDVWYNSRWEGDERVEYEVWRRIE